VPRARTRGRGKTFVTVEILISERPAEAADRAVPGHWEGDLILGLGSSAIGTLVERTTRSRCCCTCPVWKDTATRPGSRTARRWPGTAQAVRDAIADSITGLPEQLRRSLTWDRGAELAADAAGDWPGVYCLARIQNDRGGWQPQATLNRSPVLPVGCWPSPS
jgi:IS30 family transposase